MACSPSHAQALTQRRERSTATRFACDLSPAAERIVRRFELRKHAERRADRLRLATLAMLATEAPGL